ncbi:hypothetical protein QUA81_31810 [Microcoleus sp. F6_B4]
MAEDNFKVVYHQLKVATLPAIAIAPDWFGVYPSLAYINSDSACGNPKVFHHWEAATLPAAAIAPSTEISPPHASPLHSEPKPAPTTADGSSEATPSDEIDVEAEIADMVGMIRTALSSDPQDVEGAVSSVNEVIKAVRKTVGISNSVI